MGSGPVYVRITADVTDLTAKLAVAKEEFKSANVDLRDMAQQMAAAGNSANAELKSGLIAAAQSAAAARAELAALNTQMKEAQASTGGLAASFTGMRESIEATMAPLGALNSLVTTFSEVFLIAFAGERIIAGIEHVAELGAGLIKLHEQTGVAVETLSGLHYASGQLDVDAGSLDSSIEKLGKNIQAALSNPASTAAEAFTAMGFTTEELRQHSNDLIYVFMKMADSFHDHAAGAQADAIAMAAIGRGGVAIIPVLREGSQAIQEQIEKQKELGSQLTFDSALAMEKHKQAVKDLGQAWDAFGLAITNLIVGPLTRLVEKLTEIAEQTHPLADYLASHGIKPFGDVDFPKVRVTPENPGLIAAGAGGAEGGSKPEFGNLTKPEKLTGKDASGFTDAELGIKKGMSDFDTKYFAIVKQESKDLSASIVADTAKTAGEIKTYAEENFQNFRESIDEQKDAAKGNYDEQLRLDKALIDRARELYGEDNTNFRQSMRVRFADLRAQIDQQMQPWTNLVHGIGNSFQQMFNGILQGTQTFRQMMANMASNLLATFAQMEIKSAETWALNEIRKSLVTVQQQAIVTEAYAAGEVERQAVADAAYGVGAAAQAAAGSASVFADANKAAAGAYSAVVGIPYVGPILAPPAAAVAFGAVMAFDVFSAAGGFDVPAGVSPMTQLHPREMVLPEDLSDGIRSMVGSGQGGGGGDTHIHNWNIKTNDAASFLALLNQPQIMRGVISKLKSSGAFG